MLPFPIIYGPTASGKSAMALAVADALAARGHAAELVTADAFQIYRGMDIGTAKPTAAELARVRHHLIDLVDPHTAGEVFSVENWLSAAEAVIGQIRSRGVVPVVVGGTSLYIQSLLFGLFEGPPADERLREELREMEPQARWELLQQVDAAAAAKLHPADERRTVRAIEVFRLTGVPISVHQAQWSGKPARADARLYIVNWEKEALNRRINARVKAMVTEGLVEEVRTLCAIGPLNAQAREAIGYKQLLHLFAPRAGEASGLRVPRQREIDEAVEQIKITTRHFGKNQRTWIKRIASTAGPTLLDGDVSASAHAQLIVEQLLSASTGG